MTGPEHYIEAEKLLRIAADTECTELAADCQEAAQVHATLALTAATAQAGLPRTSDEEWYPWIEAVGVVDA